MFENEKALLMKLCQKSNAARQEALCGELCDRGVRYENWADMAVVVPAAAEEVVVVCAHYDAVPYSFGFNDNGMALVLVLGELYKLPRFAEMVFTNYEEEGMRGAEFYLKNTRKKIKGCVNLDACGCFSQVYLDTLNFPAARSLADCKQGIMPMSDAHAFTAKGISTVCFSSGPAETSFRRGIGEICMTLHNNCRDNDIKFLNFAMIEKVAEQVHKAVNLMAA